MTELVKSTEDLKKHIAIDFIDDFEVLEYAIEDREREIKKDYIGAALWVKLIQAYTSSGSSSSSSGEDYFARALYYVQRIVANLALLDYIPEGSLDISSNGIRITVNDTKKQAFDWQIKNLEKKYQSAADRNLELLLEYLNENTDQFTDWTDSPAYIKNKGRFINSAKQFNDYLGIKESHMTFIALQPVIDYVEDFYMRSVLGDDFFDELKERIKDGEDVDSSSASGADEYDQVFHLIRGAVAHYTGMEASEDLGTNEEKCEKKASHYIQRLVAYLDTNANESLFATYYNSDKYTAPPSTSESSSYEDNGGIDNSEFTGVYGAF